MRVLFLMRHPGYVRIFESTLRMLCDRGHEVHAAFRGRPRYAQLDPDGIAQQLAGQYPNFTHGQYDARGDGWALLGRQLRLALDYLRYFGPEYRDAPKLRERARREAPEWAVKRFDRARARPAPARRLLKAWLRAMDRAIPPDPRITAYIRDCRPDLLAVTPLIEPGAPQAEYLRSAHALGVPTTLCVASWDNLTNKGLIHGDPDVVTVWNHAMKREAVRLHDIPDSRIAVTGAAAFDHWYEWKPATTREEFCARVGLPADRPYLLYVCSSKFIAPEEVPFVRRWAASLRGATSAALRDVGVLVRPHPQHTEQWADADLSDVGPIAVWPYAGAAPVDAASRSGYFDAIYHSAAVVGVNTTAQIESAIVGRSVYTVLAPEFRESQEGTLHFQHLREAGGGFLHVAKDIAEHVAHLEAALGQRGGAVECRRFLEAFVRPYGSHVAATPRLVEVLETAARLRPGRSRPTLWASLLRPRLARRAAQLERAAVVKAASAAERDAVIAARESRREARASERAARLAHKASAEEARRVRRADADAKVDRVAVLHAEFRALSTFRRRQFLKTIAADIPERAFLDLHAATPPRRVEYDQADIYLRVLTKGEEFRLRGCLKEPFTVEWIHNQVAPGEVLYDIGANVGVYSLVAAKKKSGGARVFAFEASYATVASLTANIVLNDAADAITPLPVALSNATGMNVFDLRDLEPGAASHALGAPTPDGVAPRYRQPVMTFRLDDLVELLRLPSPNHIKLDVDGGELAVLEGATRTLSSPDLRSLLVEVSTADSDAVTRMLADHGLHVDSKITLKRKTGEDHVVWYGLFTRDGRGATGAK